jgi:protein-disulfide isomerase
MNDSDNQKPQEINEDHIEKTPRDEQPSEMMVFKRTHVYTALLPLAFVAGLAFGYIFWGRDTVPLPEVGIQDSPGQDVPVQDSAQDNQVEEVVRFDVSEDDDPVYGPPTAEITIIEFSDFECPYCRKWHNEIWPRLKDAYPDQIRLVYRDFPLTNIHPNATPAASAANCAGDQDRYWDFNDLLYSGRLSLNNTGYQVYAEELNLDLEAFKECLESGRHNSEVMADFEYAANLGVSSTPTFFVNGIPIVGAQPFETFSSLIDKELAGEIP